MNPEEIAELLNQIPPLHSRVHRIFLPISVRNNRVEDIFLDFLDWLVPTMPDERTHPDLSATATPDFILEQIEKNTNSFRLTEDAGKRELVRRWIRNELMVDPRQSNRTSQDAVSIVPLHSAVTNYFTPPGNAPNYGGFICELLARVDGGINFELLDGLAAILGDAGNDLVAGILQHSLSSDVERTSPPKYRAIRANEGQRKVWSISHANAFQDQIRSVLAYQGTISRRTLVEWLYSVVTFFISTYFLRMALAADAYAKWVGRVFDGEYTPWTLSVDDERFAPRIPYACRNESHSRLLKRFPGYTSEVIIAERFAEIVSTASPAAMNLWEAGDAIIEASQQVDAEEVFRRLADVYPTKNGERRMWRLPEGDKRRLIELNAVNSFLLVAQIINFEDMARSSNNVMEWQFYSTLAKHPHYGFARKGRTGAILAYRMSDALLVAFSHCHMQQLRSGATFSSFMEYLSQFGFVFDAEGRAVLEKQLQELGMLEDLSDASDAKYLAALYPDGGE